jgi:glucan biosynthesis protein C
MTANSSTSSATERYHDIDWLRVFATMMIFLFHAAKPFISDPWHIKNAQVEPVLEFIVGLVDVWMMPLLFVVSGMSIALSLRSRAAPTFLQERAKRLLVPFVFGVLFLSPLLVYVERLHYGQFAGSFFDFLPHAFDGLYLDYAGEGNFAWMGIHLWYLGVLLIYSCLLLPLFIILSRGVWRERLARMGSVLERPGLLLLPALPLMLLSTLNPYGLGMRQLGMWNLPVYLAMLIYGFLIIRTLGGYEVLYRYRWLALPVWLAAGLVAAPLDGAEYGTIEFFIGQATRGLVMWSSILLLLGLFYPLRRVKSSLLRYTSEMVLPFYMLHQPVIVLAGYYLVLRLNLPPLAKYGLLIVMALPVTVLIYEFLVRRSNLLRVLHGLKPLSPVAKPVVEKKSGELRV